MNSEGENENEKQQQSINTSSMLSDTSLPAATLIDENNGANEILDETHTSLSGDIYTDLIDDVLFGLILQIHRASKLGYLFYMDPDTDPEFDKQFDIYDDNDVLGVFSHLNENFKVSGSGRGNQGSSSNNNNLIKYECVCPNCDRNVAAIRFAPHLEKCMGMGRSSSRIATRRIANYNGDELDQLIEATGMIPNHHRSNDSYQSNNSNASSSNQTRSNDSDLISIINSVATSSTLQNSESLHVSSSCSSVVDIDVSSNSSSCSVSNNNNNSASLKPRAAKKRKTQKNSTNNTANTIQTSAQLPSNNSNSNKSNNGQSISRPYY